MGCVRTAQRGPESGQGLADAALTPAVTPGWARNGAERRREGSVTSRDVSPHLGERSRSGNSLRFLGQGSFGSNEKEVVLARKAVPEEGWIWLKG